MFSQVSIILYTGWVGEYPARTGIEYCRGEVFPEEVNILEGEEGGVSMSRGDKQPPRHVTCWGATLPMLLTPSGSYQNTYSW